MKAKPSVRLAAGLLLSALSLQPWSLLHAATTIDAVNRYAYGANLGWQDWRGNTNNGAVIGQYVCSGYIYAANVGWINLGSGAPTNHLQYQNLSASDFGVNRDSSGNLRGCAWGANIGWLNFETNGAARVDLATGNFSGYAYSANCGWVSLSNAVAYVQTDSLQPGPPPAPTALAAVGGQGQISLSWMPSAGATNYNVYRGTAPGALLLDASSATTNYTDSGLTAGATYWYAVTAVNSYGEESVASSVASGQTAPPAPTALAAVAGNGQVTLSWMPSAGATSYDVYFSTSSGTETTLIATVTTTGYTNLNLADDVAYYYVVTAVDSGGQGADSSEVFATPYFPTTIDAANHYAYGANLGWLDWRGNTNNGAVIGEYVCSGYIYAANVGWINLGSGSPTNGMQYRNLSASDFGVNQDGQGNLRGYAWGANIGWLNFEANGAAKVNLLTGKFSGYAYSANCGWISLSNAFAYVQTDSIRQGPLAPNGLPVAWLLANFGTINVDPNADPDGDGMSNLEEYLAGTNPNDPTDVLRITSFQRNVPAANYNQFTWNSKPTRFYALEYRSALDPGSTWAGWGGVPSTAGLNTVTILDFADQRFFRIRAYRPLQP